MARSPRSTIEPAVDVGSLELDLAEVKQLWWFLDGAIMAPDVRDHVRRSWGFCPRHAWGFAVAEIELRGGRPFATAILYEDLTRRAAKAVGSGKRPGARTLHRLEPQEPCFTCEYLGLGGEPEVSFRELAERTNRRERTRRLLEAGRAEWERRACPSCLGGGGLVCRSHLLAGGEASADLGAELEGLADRVAAFVGSQTMRGTPAGPLEQASWIEALGWFAGWDYPRKGRKDVEPTG
jgi:hypothetical protein